MITDEMKYAYLFNIFVNCDDTQMIGTMEHCIDYIDFMIDMQKLHDEDKEIINFNAWALHELKESKRVENTDDNCMVLVYWNDMGAWQYKEIKI